jgi:arsenate reductase
MKKIYWLSTCDTCRTILQDMDARKKGFRLQDIKTEAITAKQLDEMKKMAESYEMLFSRRAIKYRELALKNRHLEENDYRDLILKEYTFLKRPVVILHDEIFIGSESKTIGHLRKALKNWLA